MGLNHRLEGGRVIMVGTCCVKPDPANSDDCTPTDPTTVVFKREINNQAIVSYTNGDPEVDKLAVGVWACTVDVDTPGTEKWRFEADGACHAAAECSFKVDASNL